MKERSYLILPQNRHIIPIFGLDPESLKKSANAKIQSPKEDIRHTTILNALAKFFGADGGFQGYQKQYQKIQSFQKSHDMSHYEDLVTRRMDMGAQLNAQQISERLFCSRKPVPQSLFTGFDFDWRSYDLLQYKDRRRFLGNIGYWDYRHCFNLLGDSLISPLQGDGYISQLYAPSSYKVKHEQDIPEFQQAFQQFRTRFMEASPAGWVKIIPFNDNLIFFKTIDGAFDFVLRNQRDHVPPKRFQNLDAMDIPRELDKQGDFATADYFRLDSWLEMEAHEAEKFFYASGGEAATYPGSREVKERYLKTVGKLSSGISRQHADIHPGFFKAQTENGHLYVSNLVSIREYQKFLADSDYESRRADDWDDLKSVNLDSGDLPVCVNWYDANAYIAWFERQFDIPVRLLRIQEYLQVYPHPAEEFIAREPSTVELSFVSKPQAHPDFKPNDEEVEFYYPNGNEFDGKWLTPEEFQKVQVRWGNKLVWKQSKYGPNFLISWRFGEWLYENAETAAASINTKTLKATWEAGPVERAFFHAASCGKYKYRKIGFRLCYRVYSQ